MPHREQKHHDELSKSLEKIENHNITNIVKISQDFIAPMVGFTPGLTPFSHDSVAHIISGLR
jgi:hypothetical protein